MEWSERQGLLENFGIPPSPNQQIGVSAGLSGQTNFRLFEAAVFPECEVRIEIRVWVLHLAGLR